MRLIDAEWLEDLLLMHEQNARAIEASGRKVSFTYADGIRTGYADVGLCPTIEAEPIKHGQWIWNERLGEWYCSNCDRIMNPYTVEKSEGLYEMAQPFYCGWCGAKMDEVADDEEA